ncbi:MAG: GTPase Era [Spirochaetaceae bacterium]
MGTIERNTWHSESQEYRAGFVAIVGRPSSGKSTFLNTACGHKVSIVTPIPQTTRARVRGIVSRDSGQIVFLDTPGFHTSTRKFNQRMMGVVKESLEDADAILLLLDGSRESGEEEEAILGEVVGTGKPLVIAVNKADIEPGGAEMRRETIRKRLDENGAFPGTGEHRGVEAPKPTILTMSAREEESAEAVVRALLPLLPEGEPYYPPEYYTDQEPEFRITEIVREKAMAFARQELPHAIYVGVQDSESGELDPTTGQPSSLFMRLAIYVERESQKGIIVGKGGGRIRQIREASENEIGELFDYPVKLELRVKVKPKWRRDDALLETMFE